MSIRTHVARRASRARTLFALAGIAAVLAACDTESTPLSVDEPRLSSAGQAGMSRMLAEGRAGTARFHDVTVALAEGYQPFSECVSVPGVGGMGIHFGKYELFMDAGYTPGEPEILLYEPQDDGTLKLVGVEYAVPQQAWHEAGNTGAPSFAGHPFETAPGTYVLHAWIWTPNPSGVLAAYNPRITCPAGGEGHDH